MSWKLKRDHGDAPSGLCRLFAVLLFGALLLFSGSAGAASIVHPVVGGHVDIDVRLNGVSIGSATGVPITGVSVTAASPGVPLRSTGGASSGIASDTRTTEQPRAEESSRRGRQLRRR